MPHNKFPELGWDGGGMGVYNGHRTAAKNRCAQSIWGLNFGQTKHEIACRDWNHWGNAEKGGNKTLL